MTTTSKSSSLELRRVGAVRVSDQVAQQIRALIAENVLHPGDKLPSEMELSEAFEISRASVREALRMLESEGLVEVRSGAGAFVASPQFLFSTRHEAVEWLLKRQDSTIQLLQVRRAIEGLAASLAAEGISDETIDQLRDTLSQQRELAESLSNLDRLVELDVRFHEIIARASGNAIAQDIICSIIPSFFNSNRAVLYVTGNMSKTLEEHQRIVDALASHDPRMAEGAVRAHIIRVSDEVKGISPDSESAQAKA